MKSRKYNLTWGEKKNSIIKFDDVWLLLSKMNLITKWNLFAWEKDENVSHQFLMLELRCTLSSSEIRGFLSRLLHFMIIWRLFALNVLFLRVVVWSNVGILSMLFDLVGAKALLSLLGIVLMSSRISQVSAVRIFQPCQQLSSLNFTNGRIENWNSTRIREKWNNAENVYFH